MLASESVASTVLAATDLPIGTESFPLKIQLDLGRIFKEDQPLIHYQVAIGPNGQLVSCDEKDDTWMKHVQWAKDCQSQNLQLTVKDGKLIFRIISSIRRNEELLIWFSPEVSKDLEIPFLTPVNIRGYQQYVCHICNRSFKNPNPLKIHLGFQCSDQAAPSPHNHLLRHIITPSPQIRPTFPCRPYPIRPVVNPRQPPVDWHRVAIQPINSTQPIPSFPPVAPGTKTVTPRRGHQCIYCGKLYSRKYGLKIHIRTHTGYKPLKCRVCFRQFGDPSNLNKHVRLHAQGDTPYRCDLCGKVLVRRRDLERHVKSRHPNSCNNSSVAASVPKSSQVITVKEENL